MGSVKKQLEQKQLQLYDLMMGQIQKANTPDPMLEKLKGINSNVVDWYTNPTAVKDIYKHPTLAAQIDPFQAAISGKDDKRIGTGVLGARMNSAGSPYAQDLALERNFRRRLAGGQMLSNALSGEYDKASSNLAGLVGADNQRTTGSNSLMANFNNALSQGIESRSLGSWLKPLLGGVATGVGSLITKI